MRRALIAVCAATLALGCAQEPKKAAVDPFEETRDSSCYTVDLFTKFRINTPSDDVPAAWRRYSGRWGGGKWAGEWCHDLYVLDIKPDGTAKVIETYAPYEPWGRRATAYTRTAQIGQDGRLRVRYGSAKMEYWIEGDELRGTRDEVLGRLLIAMERRSI